MPADNRVYNADWSPDVERLVLGERYGKARVMDATSGEELLGYRITQVRMRDYGDDEIAAYIAAGHAWDKAGAYGIQDAEFRPVARVAGCYLNVVGLPPCTLMRLLNRLGIFPTIDPAWAPPGRCGDCRRLVADAKGRERLG